MQVKFQDNHVWRASTRRRKLGKKWRSTGSVFSLPTESLWDYTQYSHNLRQDPCSGPVAAPEGQNFSAVLSPSNYKWQKRFHWGKRYYWLCQLHSTSSPPHRHGRATLECFSPDSLSIPIHRTKHSPWPPPCWLHKGDKSETAPAGYNTHLYGNLTLWCFWCIVSFFSPPNPNSYTSEMQHYQPMQK